MGPFDETPGVGLAREIGVNCEHLAAARAANLFGGLFQRLLAPGADREIAAFAG